MLLKNLLSPLGLNRTVLKVEPWGWGNGSVGTLSMQAQGLELHNARVHVNYQAGVVAICNHNIQEAGIMEPTLAN